MITFDFFSQTECLQEQHRHAILDSRCERIFCWWGFVLPCLCSPPGEITYSTKGFATLLLQMCSSENRMLRTQFFSYKGVSYIFEKEIQSPFQNGVTHLCSSKIDQMPADFSRHTQPATHSIWCVRGAPQEIGWHLVNFWATEMCHTVLERKLNFLFKNDWQISVAPKLSSREPIFRGAHLQRKGTKTLWGTVNPLWRGT